MCLLWSDFSEKKIDFMGTLHERLLFPNKYFNDIFLIIKREIRLCVSSSGEYSWG